MEQNALLRALPKVDTLAEAAMAAAPEGTHTAREWLDAARTVAETLRREVLSGACTALPDGAALLDLTRRAAAFRLRPALNATGVVLHTNLGRAPLAEAVAEHVKQVAMGYSTLEYDVETGSRGSRHAVVESLLCRLCGAEAAMVVNNNAAAVLLALAASCRGKEVIVSRGELVEIGGSFRVPQVLEQSGATLREVGTTNKTRLADYEAAIDPEATGGLLKVHTSNFKMVGFTEAATPRELALLARRAALPLIYDLGSGAMDCGGLPPIGDEPTVGRAVASGADAVTFSGDKLLGGPQAGIVLGGAAFVAAMKAHPLARAFRIDKLSLAALEATLRLYLEPAAALEQIPTLAALHLPVDALQERAQTLAQTLVQRLKAEDMKEAASGCEITVERLESQVGGGSAPGQALASYGVAVRSDRLSPDALDARLRAGEPPIIGRISKDRTLLDVRTLPTEAFPQVAAAFAHIFAGEDRGL